ncbi:hypothetical protein TFLX_03853 [Thermoflexales bacterium]|nr:hypothetical protein TFLX_03853 [Thermoflexales bacterium]
MKRITFLTFFLVISVLLLRATDVLAQNPTPPHSAAALAFQRVWPFIGNNTEGASVAVDAAGGVHLGFSAYTAMGGAWPAYYAYCAANCQNAANWTTTIVGDLGTWGGSTRLILDAAGHPRLLWFNETSISGPGVFQYAECNTACTNAANWTRVNAATTSSVAGSSYFSRYFVLDQQGHPRFIYTDTDASHPGTYYAYCDTGCSTSSTNWHEVQISSAYLLYEFSLVFDSNNGIHLAYRDATAYPDTLGYGVCTSNCTNADNWNSITLTDLGSGAAFSLRVDTQRRPRLAFYTGYLGSGNPANNLVEYVWCNTTCLQIANWDSYAVGLPASYGAEVDLALDQQNRPHLAYYVDDVVHSAYGLGYATCTTDCETQSAAWQAQFVETSNELDASDPIPIQSGCSISSWLEVGHTPVLALDAGGNPRIGYTAQHYQGGTCTIHSDMRLVRFARAGNSTPPAPTPPASVVVDGPAIGVINTSYTFTATVSPITATTPITYVWQATGLTTQTHTGRGTSDTVTFTWPAGATGLKTISVSATNQAGTKSSSRTILISATPIVFNHWVYLPAIRKP